MLQKLPQVPSAAFDELLRELRRKPITVNNYRIKTGEGRSQAFGIVNKRCLPPDLSRQCFMRPYLYHLLCEYADRYVPIDWDACTVNMNFKCQKHRDRGNVGLSYIVAFGNYWDGDLLLHEPDLSGSFDIEHNPLIFDANKTLHSVSEFSGERYSLVFYKLARGNNPDGPCVPRRQYRPILCPDSKEWVIAKVNPDGSTTIIKSLPHPLRGRKKKSLEIVDESSMELDEDTAVVSASEEAEVFFGHDLG